MEHRVLVVDDDETNRKLACAMLGRLGWQSAVAADGRAALAMLADDHAFEFILLDISMPGLSGEEVCQRLRADPRTASLPIIAYTAHALAEEHQHILAAGFDAILVKPINVESLRTALTKAGDRRAVS